MIDPSTASEFWRQAVCETAGIVGICDIRERNRLITKAYAGLFLRNREILWVGAAAFVSKDIGGELSKLSTVTVWGDLGHANGLVFDDLHKYFRYYELMKGYYGRDNLAGLSEFLPETTHKAVREGLERLCVPGCERDACFMLLDYEQKETLQAQCYESRWFRLNLTFNRLCHYEFGRIDIAFDHRLPENTPDELGREISFDLRDGRLQVYAERIVFSHRIMNKFLDLMDDGDEHNIVLKELRALADGAGEEPGYGGMLVAAFRQALMRSTIAAKAVVHGHMDVHGYRAEAAEALSR